MCSRLQISVSYAPHASGLRIGTSRSPKRCNFELFADSNGHFCACLRSERVDKKREDSRYAYSPVRNKIKAIMAKWDLNTLGINGDDPWRTRNTANMIVKRRHYLDEPSKKKARRPKLRRRSRRSIPRISSASRNEKKCGGLLMENWCKKVPVSRSLCSSACFEG